MGRLRGILGGKQDVDQSALIAADHEMRQALSLLRDYEQSGLGWFWSTDSEGRIVYISDVVAGKFGKSSEELVGQPFHTLFCLDGEDRGERTLPLIFSTRKTFSQVQVRVASGYQEIWLSISGRPQIDASGTFTGFHGNGADATVTRQTQRDASRLASFDPLTGLANRHSMSKRLTATLAAYKTAKRSCALLMIDLDRFKQINDALGHPAGDEVLKQVAQRLVRVIPEGAELGRLGADEFQVIVPDIDDRGRLGEIAKKIIDMISQPYTVNGSRCVIAASVGVAIAPYDGIDSDELVRSADLSLHAAKSGGRGQFRFYSHELHREAERRRRIEEDLRDALAKDEIYLKYQPILDVASNKVIGMESLMRWRHPEIGEVSPSVFIPVAEEANLIAALGAWALKQACSDAVRLPGNVRVAVNVSAPQFADPQFPACVAQALAASGLPPQRLELEVTESIFLSDDEGIEKMFKSLKALGVRLSLDDFGTGYSSLGYLKKADFDKIKIDQGFIRGVTEPGSRNVAIIRSIVSLAEGLDMETTAEGIEALDELELMRELGVQTIQGHIYAKAVSAGEVREAMASGEWIIEPSGPVKCRPERYTMLRKIGVIHEDHRYDATIRNLSRTGCLIEGLLDVPLGTHFVIDFGEGQLAVASVRRSTGAMQGLEFETPMVDDGAGGLCTRNRVSPYVLAAAGMPLAALPSGNYPLSPSTSANAAFSMPRFAQANDPARKSLRAASN